MFHSGNCVVVASWKNREGGCFRCPQLHSQASHSNRHVGGGLRICSIFRKGLEGKVYRKPQVFGGDSTGVSCRFSLKPIHWLTRWYQWPINLKWVESTRQTSRDQSHLLGVSLESTVSGRSFPWAGRRAFRQSHGVSRSSILGLKIGQNLWHLIYASHLFWSFCWDGSEWKELRAEHPLTNPSSLDRSIRTW